MNAKIIRCDNDLKLYQKLLETPELKRTEVKNSWIGTKKRGPWVRAVICSLPRYA